MTKNEILQQKSLLPNAELLLQGIFFFFLLKDSFIQLTEKSLLPGHDHCKASLSKSLSSSLSIERTTELLQWNWLVNITFFPPKTVSWKKRKKNEEEPSWYWQYCSSLLISQLFSVEKGGVLSQGCGYMTPTSPFQILSLYDSRTHSSFCWGSSWKELSADSSLPVPVEIHCPWAAQQLQQHRKLQVALSRCKDSASAGSQPTACAGSAVDFLHSS